MRENGDWEGYTMTRLFFHHIFPVGQYNGKMVTNFRDMSRLEPREDCVERLPEYFVRNIH